MGRPAVRRVADNVLAYVQAPCSWGQANAGLIHTRNGSVLIDTLFDRARTAAMLSDLKGQSRSPHIGTVINTHANGDHWWGNGELPEAEIIATRAALEEMERLPPAAMDAYINSTSETTLVGKYLRAIFGAFRFSENDPRLPTRTFEQQLTIDLDDIAIDMLEVGPAHTAGDLIVSVPTQSVVFTGDIIFADAHPIVWSGPISRWVAACDTIVALAPEVVVPGHGEVCDLAMVRSTREYLQYIQEQADLRRAAGMSAMEAARDISLEDFRHWRDAERVVANVHAAYREGDAGEHPPDYEAVTADMATLAAELGYYGLSAAPSTCHQH